ncbi:hypothetical protein [Pedobacter alpinus]|uniref:DUF1036 domain-containing protein n=1 Tax=Pedobacter alpinus TaxID=1590643 RepID=A0ABW5TNY3_9SPHI
MISIFCGCSRDAETAAKARDADPNIINGSWKEQSTGLVISIIYHKENNYGAAFVSETGTAFPPSAKRGRCIDNVRFIRGLYWEGDSYKYFPAGTGGSTTNVWKSPSIVGFAMRSGGNEFVMGTKTYRKL